MKRVLEDHRVLKGYVDFVGAQFHKAIDDEQQGHDKQVLAANQRRHDGVRSGVTLKKKRRPRASCCSLRIAGRSLESSSLASFGRNLVEGLEPPTFPSPGGVRKRRVSRLVCPERAHEFRKTYPHNIPHPCVIETATLTVCPAQSSYRQTSEFNTAMWMFAQVNVLRATEEIGEIEKSRVREEAKAEVLAAKKELRTLSKRMDQQCTREVCTTGQ